MAKAMVQFRIVITVFLIAFYSCSPHERSESHEGPVRVTDFRGKELVLSRPAERVVCLIESALSGIYMLGQQHRLVAVPSSVYDNNLFQYYSRLDERIKERSLPAPGNWDFISLEQIASLKPDLVIIWASQTNAIESIERLGIPVYAVMLHSFEDVYKEISDFGLLLDSNERADSLIELTKGRLSQIKSRYETDNPVSVYFMWAQGITETSGLNSTVNELLTVAGTVNACPMDHEHLSVSIEKLYDWDPDMIVMWYNERMSPEDVINNPLLQGLRAVKNRRVYQLPDLFSCDFWTLKMQFPAKLTGSWAYSDSIDKEKILNDIYLSLYGIPL